MKKLLVLLMALGLFAAMPVLAAEHEGMKMDSHEGMMMETPDGARECALQAESIQQKIKRLNIEVAQGTKKHSAEDLKKLENQLKETNKLLDQMNKR
jgi:septal ring factor EnvC (AmiA/AmiB activator)